MCDILCEYTTFVFHVTESHSNECDWLHLFSVIQESNRNDISHDATDLPTSLTQRANLV